MSDGLKELLWMVGCTSVMAAVGVIALVGYLRMKRESTGKKDSASQS